MAFSFKGIAIKPEWKKVPDNTMELTIAYTVNSPIELANHPVYAFGLRTFVKENTFPSEENATIFIRKRLFFEDEYSLSIQGKINSPTYLKLRILRL